MPIVSATPPPATAARKPVVSKANKRQEREDAVAGVGQITQIPLMAMRLHADVGAIGMHWPNISKEVAKLADTQEAVAGLIDPLIKIGPYTALVAALMPLVVQLAVNHKMMAPGTMGSVPPTLLQAQVETMMAQAEMEALRQQKEAEEAAAEMRKAMSDARAEKADA